MPRNVPEVMRERRNVVLTPRVWWAHEHEATLVRSAPYCGPPLPQAVVSCLRLRLRSPLRTLLLRHRQVLPFVTLQKHCREIHRILIIVSQPPGKSKDNVSFSWCIDCPMPESGAPWPAGHYPLLCIPEASLSSHETWQQQKMDRLTRNYSHSQALLTANVFK